MLKLLKYEFIKNKHSFYICLSIVGILELIIFANFLQEDYSNMLMAFFLQFIATLVIIAVGLVIGTKTYTSELTNKSGYLLYMTPNSPLKIVFSKFVFSLIIELFYMLVFFLLTTLNVTVLFGDLFDAEDVREIIAFVSIQYSSITSDPVLLTCFTILLSWSLNIFAIVGFYDLCYTISCTLISNLHGKKLLTTVLFVFVGWFLLLLNSFLSVFFADPIFESTQSAFLATLPHYLYYIVLTCGCMFGISALLEKKINL